MNEEENEEKNEEENEIEDDKRHHKKRKYVFDLNRSPNSNDYFGD